MKCFVCGSEIEYEVKNSWNSYTPLRFDDVNHFGIIMTEDGRKMKIPVCDDCFDDAE